VVVECHQRSGEQSSSRILNTNVCPTSRCHQSSSFDLKKASSLLTPTSTFALLLSLDPSIPSALARLTCRGGVFVRRTARERRSSHYLCLFLLWPWNFIVLAQTYLMLKKDSESTEWKMAQEWLTCPDWIRELSDLLILPLAELGSLFDIFASGMGN